VPRRLVGIGLCRALSKKVRRLVLVGAPIDIAAAESQLSRFVADVPLRMFDELVRQASWDPIEHAKHHWQIPLKAEKSPRCDRTAMIRGFSRPILNS
jgi:hypothetical protein